MSSDELAAGTRPGAPERDGHLAALEGQAAALAGDAERFAARAVPESDGLFRYWDRAAAGDLARAARAAAGFMRSGDAEQAIGAVLDAQRCASQAGWTDLPRIDSLLKAAEDARRADLPMGAEVTAGCAAAIAAGLRAAIGRAHPFSLRYWDVPGISAALASLDAAAAGFGAGREDEGIAGLAQAAGQFPQARAQVLAVTPLRYPPADPYPAGGEDSQDRVGLHLRRCEASTRRLLAAARVIRDENTRPEQPGPFPVRITWDDGRAVYAVVPGSRRRAALVADAIRNGKTVTEGSSARWDLSGSPDEVKELISCALAGGWEAAWRAGPGSETVTARRPGAPDDPYLLWDVSTFMRTTPADGVTQTWIRDWSSIDRHLTPDGRREAARKRGERSAAWLAENKAAISARVLSADTGPGPGEPARQADPAGLGFPAPSAAAPREPGRRAAAEHTAPHRRADPGRGRGCM